MHSNYFQELSGEKISLDIECQIKYWKAYKKGDYEFCLNYLKQNRELLTIEHTPEHYKIMYMTMLEQFEDDEHIILDQKEI